MLKGKIWIWALLVILCFGIKFKTPIINFFSDLFKTDEVTLTINDEDQRIRTNFIQNDKYSDIIFTLVSNTKNTPDVIIERSSKNTYDGYDKYSEELATPMAMFFNENILKNSTGFIKSTKGSDSKYVLQKDLKNILEGLESDKDWSEIGIDALNGKIEITVPNENSPYYNDTIKFMLVNLYDTETNDDNIGERLSRIAKIYKKCNIVDDIISFIEQNSEYENMCIAPEIYVQQSKYFRENNDYCDLAIVYSTKEYVVKYDIFLKKELEINDDIIRMLRNNDNFNDNIGLRSTNTTYSVDKLYNSSHFIEYININDYSDKINVSNSNNLLLNNSIFTNIENTENNKEIISTETNEDTEQNAEEESENINETEISEAEENDSSSSIVLFIIIFVIIFFAVLFICVIAFS